MECQVRVGHSRAGSNSNRGYRAGQLGQNDAETGPEMRSWSETGAELE